MKKILFTIFSLVMCINTANALDVVYPTKTYAKINSPSTFFVGAVKSGDRLVINHEEIPVHTTGAFAQSVKLNTGKN